MTEQDLTNAILRYSKWWEISPKEINNGFCGAFAHMVIEHLGGETEDLYESFSIDFAGGHVWITYKTKHYDAECPTGVENQKDLPFFVRGRVLLIENNRQNA